MEIDRKHPDDKVTAYRDAPNVPGLPEAQRRIMLNCGRLLAAWNSLEIISWRDAEDYLKEQLAGFRSLDDKGRTQVLMIVLGFAMVAVEADRKSERSS